MRKQLLITAALFTGLLTASATVTPYGWWRMGEANGTMTSYMADSSGNAFNFNSTFENSAIYPGDVASFTNVAVGGPLGPNKIYSTASSFSHLAPNNNGGYVGAYYPASWNFATNRNWVMECWVLPIANGVRNNGSANGCILNMGGQNFAGTVTNWGCEFWCVSSNDSLGTYQDGTVEIQCWCVGNYQASVNPQSGQPNYLNAAGNPWNFQLGTNYVIKTAGTNMWTHLAVVRDDLAGTVTFYINGNPMASTAATNVYQPPILPPPFLPYTQPDGPSISTFNAAQPSINGQGSLSVPPGPGQPLGASGNRQYNGFVDEVRFSTFAPGQFSTSDLLLRSIPGPGIVQQPVNVSAYSGGAAVFQVIPAFDTTATCQWYQVVGSVLTPIAGTVTTNFQLVLPGITAGMTGNKYVCALGNATGIQYSTTNTLTVVANPGTHTDYAAAVSSESSVISYFPGDGDNAAGTNLTDVVGGNTGVLSGNAEFDADTTRFANGQGLSFNRNGEWSFNAVDGVKIPYNSAYTFPSGYGTVEAVLYMDPAAAKIPIAFNYPQELYGFGWLSMANFAITGNSASPANAVQAYYVFSADALGHLFYWAPYVDQSSSADSVPLMWTVPGGTLGKRLHVAFAFDTFTNITCYVNGQNLGTLSAIPGPTANPATTLIGAPGVNLPLQIGNAGFTPVLENLPSGYNGIQTTNNGYISEGWCPASWYGSVDEVALYSTNLPANTIARHAFLLNNGNASIAVSVTNLTPSKSMYANASQTCSAVASGTPPYSYQWYTNINTGGGPIPGATNYTVTVPHIRQSVSISCVVQGAVGTATSAPTVIAITTPAVGSYADQVMSNAPVAFYRFNESGGATVYDWAGTHDGAYSGAYALVSGPSPGEGGVQFFGTNTPTALSQVDIKWAPELMALASSNTAEYTYECWYKPLGGSPNPLQGGVQADQCPVSGRFRLGNNLAGARIYFNNDNDQPEGNGVGGNSFGNGTNDNFELQMGRYNNVNQYLRFYNAPGYKPPTNVWHHVVATCQNLNPGAPNSQGMSVAYSIYVDGVLQINNQTGFYPYTLSAGGQCAPNRYADMILGYKEVGNNNPHANPCYGTIGDVAIYTYALTPAQVQQHYSAYYTPATNNGVSPTIVSTNEALSGTITLTANITGNGNTYQWFFIPTGGSSPGYALTNYNNLDGTPHYPAINNGLFDLQGVDSPVLVISEVSPADAGQYYLVVYNTLNAGGQISTATVPVSVAPDLTTPIVTGAAGLGQVVANSTVGAPPVYGSAGAPGLVEVYFSKRMDPTTAMNPANYTISGGVTVTNVFIGNAYGDTRFKGAWMEVGLQTSALTPGQNYTITVSGVKDQTYSANLIAPTTEYFTAPVAKSGVVWDYYAAQYSGMLGLTSGQYDNSTFTPYPVPFTQGTNCFPFVPQYEITLTNFDSRQISGAPYTNTTGAFEASIGYNPIFGTGSLGSGEASYYGSLISGWLTPTNSDFYDFFLIDDDAAAVYLSTDDTAANASMVAQGIGVNTVFQEPPSPWLAGPSSQPGSIYLTANQPYFIEVIHYQIAGGDYAAVAWRSENGPDSTTPAANLQPIPGAFLTSWGRPAVPVMSAQVNGNQLTITWSGSGRLMESSSLSVPITQWTPVAGNPSSPYNVPVGSGHMFYAVVQ